jgi:predicted DNA-binding protein
MSTQMIIRMEPELKDKVTRVARTEGKTTSEVVRELLEEYISSRDIAAYVDGLWERIGAQLETQGITADRIPETIQEVRRSKA